MKAARVRMLRQWLGMEDRILAPLLGISEITLRNYQRERKAISPAVQERLEALVARSDDLVEEILASLEGVAEPRVLIFRSNDELWAAHPRLRPMPVGWHRMIISRVVDAMPEVDVDFPPKAEG